MVSRTPELLRELVQDGDQGHAPGEAAAAALERGADEDAVALVFADFR